MTPCFNLLLELALFLTFPFAFEISQYLFLCCHPSGFFPSSSLQPVNGCKNSVLNWVMKLNLLSQTPLKIFPFYSLIILTLWFRYLQTQNSKIRRKTQEKCISQWIANLNFKNFLFSVYHVQTAKKLNLWGNTAVDESVTRKTPTLLFLLEKIHTEGTKKLVGKSCGQKQKHFHLWGIYIQTSKATVPVSHNTKVDDLPLKSLTGQIL